MPTFFTHNITNISKDKDLQALFWANEIFDEHNPDTYFMEV
jgi:UDP-2-acetamido-2,6-beta-L-arabino-hexul-4-ose reductase